MRNRVILISVRIVDYLANCPSCRELYMLEFFRRHSRLVMILLVVLVLPSFVFFGVADYQSFTTNEVRLATINDQKILQSDFNQSWTQRLNELRSSQGAEFDLSQADTPAAREAWLNSMINSYVTQETAIKDRFSASDAMVRFALAQTPQFLENGQFSMKAYNDYLNSVGLTSQQYEANVRGYEALRLVVNPVLDSVVLPESTMQALESAMTEDRSVRLRIFSNSEFAKDVTVSEDELKQWYDKNKQTFAIPDYVNLDYVLLNQEAAMEQVKAPSDEELETYFNNNISRFSTPERRHLKHIQVADLATAEEVAKKAKQDPAQFDALAKEYSQDAGTKNNGGDLGLLKKGDIPDIDNTVFAIAQPGITDPIQVGNNYHVFQIVSIEQGSKTFAEVKDQVSKEVRLQLASERFADMATKLTHLVQEQRDSLQGVVDELGLKIQTVDGITRGGLLSQAQVGSQAAADSAVQTIFASPRVRETAFSAEVFAQGLNSGVIEISPSELLVIRVKQKVAAHVPELAQVKEQVKAKVVEEKAKEVAQKTGEAALAQLQVDNATVGFTEVQHVNRIANRLPEQVLNTIMRAPVDKLPFYVGIGFDDGYIVARIEAVDKNNAELRKLFEQYQIPALAQIVGAEVGKGFAMNLRQKNKIEIFPAAQQAIAGEQKQ